MLCMLPSESISSSEETTSARMARVSKGESKSAISGAISLKNLQSLTDVASDLKIIGTFQIAAVLIRDFYRFHGR